MNIVQSIIIAVVEGITEFLPVSSTGHMIIAQKLLGVENNDFVKLFTINIQLGAILSVVVLYWKKFLEPLKKGVVEGTFVQRFKFRFDFYLKLIVAVIPAAIVGLLFIEYVYALLESVAVVAISLVLGGIVLLFVDKWFNRVTEDQEITYPKAIKIGIFQIISMVPGVSRSAATIIGGLTQGLSRKNAAEFSFFLAVPTMLAASALEFYKTAGSITVENIEILVLGNIVAFVVALLAIKGFITFLTKHGFRVFGYYRILVGVVILVLLMLGVDLNMVS